MKARGFVESMIGDGMPWAKGFSSFRAHTSATPKQRLLSH
jgi:hypothetical protein